MLFAGVEKNAEVVTGLPVEVIRKYSAHKFRKYLEQRNKKKLTFTSEFPVIGRRKVTDNIISTGEINKCVDKIINGGD